MNAVDRWSVNVERCVSVSQYYLLFRGVLAAGILGWVQGRD
ncbi:MAG: hypothetical protein ACREA0_30190 [bacterium]